MDTARLDWMKKSRSASCTTKSTATRMRRAIALRIHLCFLICAYPEQPPSREPLHADADEPRAGMDAKRRADLCADIGLRGVDKVRKPRFHMRRKLRHAAVRDCEMVNVVLCVRCRVLERSGQRPFGAAGFLHGVIYAVVVAGDDRAHVEQRADRCCHAADAAAFRQVFQRRQAKENLGVFHELAQSGLDLVCGSAVSDHLGRTHHGEASADTDVLRVDHAAIQLGDVTRGNAHEVEGAAERARNGNDKQRLIPRIPDFLHRVKDAFRGGEGGFGNFAGQAAVNLLRRDGHPVKIQPVGELDGER